MSRIPFAPNVAALLVALGLYAIADVVHDVARGGSPSLAALELLVMGAVLGIAFYFWVESARARRQARRLVRHLDRAQAEAEHWRREAANVLPALGAAVHRQFDRWMLTHDERRLALLLLGGIAMQDIAQRLETTTGTVRRQALGIYAKAGVTGRAELSAFFLQDLFYLVGVPAQRSDDGAAPV